MIIDVWWLQSKWCVARPGVSNNQMLQDNIDYACNHVDCSLIRAGGACYDPTNLISHASVVMNLFYQENGKLDSTCDFNGTGLIVISDPSKRKILFLHLWLQSSADNKVFFFFCWSNNSNLLLFFWSPFAGYGNCKFEYR